MAAVAIAPVAAAPAAAAPQAHSSGHVRSAAAPLLMPKNTSQNLFVKFGRFGARVFRSSEREYKTAQQVQPAEVESVQCFNNASSAEQCCFRACSHRGRCSRGVCLCEAPWHGLDCAHNHHAKDTITRLEEAEGPVTRAVGWSGFLYVHSPPPELGLQNARKYQRHTTTYDTEFHLVRRLLSDRQARTLWRDAASLFLVPTWAMQTWGNTGGFRTNVFSINRLSRWVRRTHGEAHWDNGSRFLFGFFGDKGACNLREKGFSGDKGKLGNFGVLVHWGLRVPWSRQMQDDADEWRPGAGGEPCTQAETDLVLPVYRRWTAATAANHSARRRGFLSRRNTQGESEWNWEFFFAGSQQHSHVPHYSQGVRKAVATHHHNRSRYLIVQRVWLDRHWLTSRFCLAPSGDGFGDRLSQSMMMGCVPVIIQPAVFQPFEGLLPYDAFSMRFGYHDIPVLHELLRNVSDAEHARLLRGVEKYAPAFNWHDVDGRAYEFVRYELCRRARDALCDHLRPLL